MRLKKLLIHNLANFLPIVSHLKNYLKIFSEGDFIETPTSSSETHWPHKTDSREKTEGKKKIFAKKKVSSDENRLY